MTEMQTAGENAVGTRRRVKVYQLNDDRQWDDRGTGHVTSQNGPDDVVSLLVRSEVDNNILLDSEIRQDTSYSKQQETLIVWSEDQNDLALSFQERQGCEEIWERICQVQGRDPDQTDPLQSSDEEPEDDLELPSPEVRNIEQIRDSIQNHCRMQRREKLSAAIKAQNYIPKLLEVFHSVEDLEDANSLRVLYEIFKSIWLLNQADLYEIMFKQEYIFDVVGIMEYNPTRKDELKHREYLKKVCKFQNVLNVDELISERITELYRMQYVQESVLPAPSMFEADNLASLASYIFFQKVDLLKMILKDPNLIESCVKDLKDEQTSPKRQVELCRFLKEFFIYAQHLQQPDKEEFLKMLLNNGILHAIEILLDSKYAKVRTLGADLICQIVEIHQHPSSVREHILKSRYYNQDNSNRRDLMTLLLKVALDDPDSESAMAFNVMYSIKAILDPENMIRNATEKPDFLGFFYKECIGRLVHYISSVATSTKMIKDDYQMASTCVIIMELLMMMVENHTYHIKNHLMHRDTLKRAMMLIQSRHTFLSLSALRLLRRIVGKGDDTYNKLIIRHDLFTPVVDALFKNGSRYNLLNSSILELFKYIHDENIKPLLEHTQEQFGERLKDIKYTDIFEKIQTKVQQEGEEQKSWSARFRPHPSPSSNRLSSPSRTDETNWFEIDDDDKNDKLGKALVDYQDSDSDGETDPDKTPVPGESTSTSKEETPSAVSEAEQENNADNEMSAEVAKESTESDKPSEEIKDEQAVPDLENVEEEIKSKENLNEDVKVGDKRDLSSENPDSSQPKRARLEEENSTETCVIADLESSTSPKSSLIESSSTPSSTENEKSQAEEKEATKPESTIEKPQPDISC